MNALEQVEDLFKRGDPAMAPLQAIDRCDRCGARARVRVTLADFTMWLFCSHHFADKRPETGLTHREHFAAVEGARVRDESRPG